MKATVNRKELLSALGKVGPAVPKRHTMPIMATVLLEVVEGKVRLTASNLGQALVTTLDAEVDAKGSVCAYPKLLVDTLKALKCEKVTLKTNEVLLKTEGADKQLVCTESGETTLTGFDPVDFPPVPMVKGKPVLLEGFAHALGMVSDCMAIEDNRPVLHGVHLRQMGKGKAEVVADDGFRMAIHAVKVKGKLPYGCIIPLEAVTMIHRLKSEVTSIVVEVKDNGTETALLEMQGVTLTTMLIQGTYPDYQQLIPKQRHAKRITVNVAELTQALKTATAIKPLNNIVRLVSKSGKLTLSATDEDNVSLANIAATGSIKIAVNYTYLESLLKRLQGDVTLYTHSVSSPILVIQDSFTYVVMPMFVQW